MISSMNSSSSPISIAIYTDIGHDCDDTYALISAFKDHMLGRVKIAYVCTVSQNNVNRALHVQWLAFEMGISDIPIIPSDREEAFLKQPIDRCILPWQWELKGNEYRQVDVGLQDVYSRKEAAQVCPILKGSSVEQVQKILSQIEAQIRIMVIGPGIEAQGLANSASKIERIVWQGLHADKDPKTGSFNIKADIEAYEEFDKFCVEYEIPQFFIGKKVAWQTALTKAQFEQLQKIIPPANNEESGSFLLKITLMGLKEWRDADPETFNQIYKLDPELAKLPSNDISWFEHMPTKTNQYDLTAYLIARDTVFGQDTPPQNPLWEIVEGPAHVFETGRNGDDIKDKNTYMEKIFNEIKEGMEYVRKDAL